MATKQRETRTLWGRVTTRVVQSRRRFGTVTAIAVAVLLGYHAFAGDNGWTAYQQKLTEDKQLAAEVKDQQQQNDRLKKHVERLGSDPDAIAYEAHVRLRYAKPDQVIVLNDVNNNSAATTAPTTR